MLTGFAGLGKMDRNTSDNNLVRTYDITGDKSPCEPLNRHTNKEKVMASLPSSARAGKNSI